MPHPAPPSPIPGTAGQDSTHPVSTHQLRQVATQTLNQHPPISRNAPLAIRAAKHRKTTQDQAHTHTHTHTQTLHPTHPGNTQTTPTRILIRILIRAGQKQQKHKTRRTRDTHQETNRTSPKRQHTHPRTHEPTNPRTQHTHQQDTTTRPTHNHPPGTKQKNKRTKHTKINTHHQTTKHKIKRL